MQSAQWSIRLFVVVAWFLTGYMTALPLISASLRSGSNVCFEERKTAEISEAEDARVDIADLFYLSNLKSPILHSSPLIGLVHLDCETIYEPDAQKSHYQRGPPVI